ncbi:hypothetical protein PC128_g6737 [Phytophthora cactorum]|nr:hypothetical protein PC128_g6737 [Phytophthora cactorum]
MERGRPECETDSGQRDVEGALNVIIEKVVRAKRTKKPLQLPDADKKVVLENVGVALGKVEEIAVNNRLGSEGTSPEWSANLTGLHTNGYT